MSYRYPSLEDLLPLQQEKDAAKNEQEAPGRDASIGSTTGSVIGGGIGALSLLIPGIGAAVAIPAISTGSAIGGALGGAAGSAIGKAQADQSQKVETDLAGHRQRILAEVNAHQQALKDLLSQQ